MAPLDTRAVPEYDLAVRLFAVGQTVAGSAELVFNSAALNLRKMRSRRPSAHGLCYLLQTTKGGDAGPPLRNPALIARRRCSRPAYSHRRTFFLYFNQASPNVSASFFSSNPMKTTSMKTANPRTTT